MLIGCGDHFVSQLGHVFANSSACNSQRARDYFVVALLLGAVSMQKVVGYEISGWTIAWHSEEMELTKKLIQQNYTLEYRVSLILEIPFHVVFLHLTEIITGLFAFTLINSTAFWVYNLSL